VQFGQGLSTVSSSRQARSIWRLLLAFHVCLDSTSEQLRHWRASFTRQFVESFDELFGQPDRSTFLHGPICRIVCQHMSRQFTQWLGHFQPICGGFTGDLRTARPAKISVFGANEVSPASCRYWGRRYTSTRPTCPFLHFNFFWHQAHCGKAFTSDRRHSVFSQQVGCTPESFCRLQRGQKVIRRSDLGKPAPERHQ
jgi:hypothetical protein